MMGLFWCEIAHDLPLPDFGGDFRAHILSKTHPDVYTASLSAWNLLALLMKENGCASLPDVRFSDTGKPFFKDVDLHFSLSHSGSLAAAALSAAPCGADIELVRPQVEERLLQRCLSDAGRQAGCDFFETWTKKECIAKLDGRGMVSHPSSVNTLDNRYAGRFLIQRVLDSAGNEYVLCGLGEGFAGAEKRSIII